MMGNLCITFWETTANTHIIFATWCNNKWCQFFGDITLHSLDHNRKIRGLLGISASRSKKGWQPCSHRGHGQTVTLRLSLVLHPVEVTRGCFNGKTKPSECKGRRDAPSWKAHHLPRIYCQPDLDTASMKERNKCCSRKKTNRFNWLHPNTGSIHPVKQYWDWAVKCI